MATPASADNSCIYAFDGICDEPFYFGDVGHCPIGTDDFDCGYGDQDDIGSESGSGSSTGTFAFEVCNETGDTAYVAILYHEWEWVVTGWYNVSPYSCDIIGSFKKGYFYYYAESSYGKWEGTFAVCVERPGPFSRTRYESYSCASNETLERFIEQWIQGPGHTLSLTY